MTELTQSRNATASEALTIMRSQGAVFRRRLGAVRHFRLARIAWLAALLGLSAVFLFACDMGWIPPVSLWVEVPVIFIVAFGLCRLWTVYYSGVCAELYRECLPGNRRLRLEA
ncbi:MAG TPA: hypothetical protein VJV39_06510, partial [Dongiaceae bacterium]|nr:hypothetical protein [Dongiaceae bacterium]